MYYNKNNSFGSEEYQDREETWDLRQFYTRYVGLYMLDYKSAEDNSNYPKMLSILDRWHAMVYGRVGKVLAVDEEGDTKINPDEIFEYLRNNLIELATKYKQTFLKKSHDSKEMGEIEYAFKDLVVYLINLMKKNSLFGSAKDIRGL